MIARALVLLCATLLFVATVAAQEAEYPNRPITMIVPYPPGGAIDVLTRALGDKLRGELGQPAVVENRPGATGGIGTGVVARAEPNGYTLLSTPNAPIVLNPFISKNLTYDPLALVPIIHVGNAPLVVSVRSDFPAKSIQEFIAYAKANPGKLNYASQGVGGGAHLATLMFQNATGTQMVHIPFGGAAPALQALVGGQVDLFIDNISSSLPLHQSGKLKILAMGSLKRAPELPDMPTLAEAGLRDLDLTTWFGMFAPPKTPAAIVTKLNGAINEIIAMPDFRSRVAALHIQLVGGTPQAFADFLAADRARWQAIIAGANIPAQ
jgi:tripartite-type tricarboxylate transporter receptor subunit TctC